MALAIIYDGLTAGYKGRRYSTLYVSISIQQTITITLTSSQYGPPDKNDSEKATVKSVANRPRSGDSLTSWA
jgi:hypothetical protein